MRTCRLTILLLLFVSGNPCGFVQPGSRVGAAPRAEDRAAAARQATHEGTGAARSQLDTVHQGAVVAAYRKFPLSFEANQGQADKRVKFLARGLGYTLFLTDQEAVLALPQVTPAAEKQSSKDSTAVLRMKLVGANPSARILGVNRQPGSSNYFIGNDPARWQTNVANSSRVSYSNAYPGIDLVYYGNQQQLEYDFVVAPGADPRAILLDLGT